MEGCPYAPRSDVIDSFWTKEGGAQITEDLKIAKLFVRGGSWVLEITNRSACSIRTEAWLSFMKKGENFVSLSGGDRKKWHPLIAGSLYNNCYQLSKWHQRIYIKPNESVCWEFKIGAFPVKEATWFSDKPGWPMLHVMSKTMDDKQEGKLHWQMERIITFTEADTINTRVSAFELGKMTRDMERLKNILNHTYNIPGADTTMQIDNTSTGG